MTMRRVPRRLRGYRHMGMTMIRARLTNVTDKRRHTDVEMTVDSGAIYSVVPSPTLHHLGVESERTETFWLADGRSVKRRVGHVFFEIQGSTGISKVIFGRPGDVSLLGVLTLEALGLSLDPLKRTLRPLKLMRA
ncbi:MAG: aspartyl protease [Candidatus Binatia bacterium]